VCDSEASSVSVVSPERHYCQHSVVSPEHHYCQQTDTPNSCASGTSASDAAVIVDTVKITLPVPVLPMRLLLSTQLK